MLSYLPLDEAAAAGGSLKVFGDTWVLGTPLLEPPHSLNADIGAAGGTAKGSQCAFDAVKKWILR